MIGRDRTIVRGAQPWWYQTTTAMLCGSALFTFPALGYAQQTTDDNGDYRLSPVLVNAQAIGDDNADTILARELWVGGKVATSIQDTPASVSVITQKEIEQRNAQTTEEVLQYTPGVVSGYYATDDRNDYFQIRGFQATTYRDGMTLGSMRGVREEPYAYERIEVLRGANSTLFGPADPGGSVNFVSKRPRFESFGEGFISYGSFDRQEAGLDVGDTLNDSGTVAYRLTGKVKDSDLEYDHSDNDDEFIMGGLTWEPTDFTSATVIFDYLNRDGTVNSGGYPFDREYDRDEFYGEPDYNFHDVERTNLTGQLTHDFDNGLTFRGNLRYSDLTDDYGYVYLNSESRVGSTVDRGYLGSDTDAEELIGNAILQYDASFDDIDSSTLAGVEFRDGESTGTSVYAAGTPIDIDNPVFSGAPATLTPYLHDKQEYDTRAVFLQQNFSFYDKFVVTAGVRNDDLDLSSTDYIAGTRESDDFSETSWRGALTYIINPEVSTYVSYVESVSPPEVGVTPERGEQYELGVKYAPLWTDALFSAAVYDLSQDDIAIPVVQGDGSIDQQTVGKSRARGLDLEVKAELTDNLSIIGGYSYLDTEVEKGSLELNGTATSIKGNDLDTAPTHTAMLWGYYTLPDLPMSFGLGARYTSSYYFDAANSAKSEDATVFDAAFNFELARNTDISLNVSNVFDEQHVVGSGTADYYNQGREAIAKLRYHW
ncbi:TonB-dependent siderophore receptor [Salinicola avicenniae]|uniref:TonB-dependent siderophore receptor n=1 Tax=Salinicola avicenniae TaxID=2916836 RepID=UPI0020739FF9|nr:MULTISPECIES: TonB-dependent siderophore receptor [unclassified Salinicola]